VTDRVGARDAREGVVEDEASDYSFMAPRRIIFEWSSFERARERARRSRATRGSSTRVVVV